MLIDLKPDWSLLVVAAIFWINYLVVRRFFLQPVDAVMSSREHDIRDAESRYESALTQFRQSTEEIEAKLHTARREGSQVREQLRGEAIGHRNQVIDQTRREADAILSAADADLQRDVASARETIRTESERLARMAAERILGRSL